MPDDSKASRTASTVAIVSAYVGKHSVAVADLAALISTVNSALANPGGPAPAAPQEPAANLRRLVTTGAIVCAECGKRFKSIKRHLTTAHGLTPPAYLAKWGLKRDHPMVAPDYAASRSELAKSIGLGRKPAPGRAKAPPKAAKTASAGPTASSPRQPGKPPARRSKSKLAP